MKIVFNELALYELEDTIDYYNFQEPGLGDKFKEEIKKSIHRITEYPTSWPNLTQNIRKYVLHKFSFKVLYSIESDHIFIIAVSHQHRKPNYWIDRFLVN